MTPRLLIADDEESLRTVLKRELERQGFAAEAVADGNAALDRLEGRSFDVLILDLTMPGPDGLEVLRRVRALDPGPEVVVLTGQGSIASAVEAMRQGAFDYLTKPCQIEALAAVCRRAAEKAGLARDNRALRRDLDRGLDPLLGESPPMQALRGQIARTGAADAPVLVLGESGSGKELVARALHAASPRAQAPWVAVNCAGFSPALLESELFGHERGAFTGADRARPGLFETADRGTLFLDEIGDMPPPLQALLLRAVQFGELRRVGADRPRTVDVRVIAATHRDLGQAVRTGAFREDLFYRLQALTLEVPPLRSRREDIPVLARHFLGRGRRRLDLGAGALKVLLAHDWPGNVRELKNLMERLALFCEGETVQERDVVAALHLRPAAVLEPEPDDLKAAEKRHIARVLVACGGRKPEAAQRLGISLKTLYNKLQKQGL